MKPVLQALLLADHAYIDAQTGKHIVIGIFSRMLIRNDVPTVGAERAAESKQMGLGGVRAGSPYVYLNLIEMRGEVELELRFVDLQEDRILLQTGFQVSAKDALDTVEAVLPVPVLPTPHAGVYSLELLSHNELLGSVRIVVEEMGSAAEGEVS